MWKRPSLKAEVEERGGASRVHLGAHTHRGRRRARLGARNNPGAFEAAGCSRSSSQPSALWMSDRSLYYLYLPSVLSE
jgi:hypothetical protein